MITKTLLDNEDLNSLAFDLAARLLTPQEVLDKHDIDRDRLAELLKNEGFCQSVITHKKEWNAPESGRKRVQVMSRMAQEAVLVDLVRIVKNDRSNNSDRINAAKEIRAGSDAGDPSAEMRLKTAQANALGGGGSSNIQINISLAGKRKTLTFDPVVEASDTLDIEEGNIDGDPVAQMKLNKV